MINSLRVIVFGCCMLFINVAQGQISPIALEKITPPNPEAGALGRFGTFPIGLNTGTPNIDIPLYRVAGRKVQVPISLRYSTNGLKVDDMPTKVGTGWILNAGGIITRTVYDKADDAYTRAQFPYTEDQFSSTTGTDLNIPAWAEQVDAQSLDTQFDEYSFNFNGYTGKFIIDLNNNPVLIPYSNLKIQINPFRITTPDGIQYSFGASDGPSYSSSGGCSRDNAHPFISTWYLTNVTNLNDPSDFVNLTYNTGGYRYHPQINQTITYFNSNNTCGTGADGDPCGCQTPCVYGTPGTPSMGIDNFCTNTIGIGVEYINDITSSLYGKVKFIYNTSYSSSTTPIAIDRLLTGIQVYQNNDGTNLLKTFNLNYTLSKPTQNYNLVSLDNISVEQPDMISYRPFLTGLQELDKLNNIIKTHAFEFNDIGNLPPRLASSQDYWGYYNGKSNHTSMIPGTSGGGSQLPAMKVADRNPDYNYALKGILTKVTYPTGGSTQIVYEGNTMRPQPITPTPDSYNTVTNVQVNNTTQNSTFYIFATTVVNIARSVVCCNGGTNTCTPASSGLVWGIINQNVNGAATVIYSYNFNEYNTRGECSYTDNSTVTLQPGIYGLKVTGFDNYQFNLTATATNGNIYQLVYEPTTTALATDGGGLRVKQQIIYDPVSQISTTTNYQYSGMIIPYTPQYMTNISYRSEKHVPYYDGPNRVCPAAAPCAELKTCNYIQYSSNSAVNSAGRGASPVYYTSVTESLGNNFIVGGTEHTYSWFPDVGFNLLRGTIIPNSSVPSSSWKNGLETNQNIFKMVNGSKVYLKMILNTYTDDSRINNSYTQYISKLSGLCETLSPNVPQNCSATSVFNLRLNVFDLESYKTVQNWTYLSSKQETNYDMNGNNPVVNTTNYFYDNPVTALLTRVETVNSKNLPVKIINKYPGDAATITNLTTSETDAITKLVAQNNISSVLENEQYVSNILQTRIHTGFKDWGAGILRPESIKSQIQPGNMESRIQFIQYDSYGNLVQQQKTNDIYESYFWGYKSGYPVAKIIGIDYNTAKQYINQTVLDNPPSDQALRDELNKLRINFPKAIVTTYTFSPLIGTTSETDVRGITRYYEYDNIQRLFLVRDQDRNILKKYCYNYAGQIENCAITYYNTAQSGASYTRTNCGSGYVGGGYVTTVAANIYNSSLSVADANQQAQNYAASVGQSNANQNGTCTPIYYNTQQSISYTRQNCGAAYNGGAYVTTVLANTYSSLKDTTDANSQATTYISSVGQHNADSLGTCTTRPDATCTFTMAGNFKSPAGSSSIRSSGGRTSFYIVFSTPSSMIANHALWLATISGGCTPSATQTIATTSSGRNWTITVYPNGQMYVASASAISANTTISLGTCSYSL